MRWLMAGAWRRVGVGWGLFLSGLAPRRGPGGCSVGAKGSGSYEAAGGGTSEHVAVPAAGRPCGGWQGETGNRGGTRRPLSRGPALGSAGGTRDGLLRRHATGRAFRPCLVGSVKFLKKYIFMFEVLNID